MIVPNAFQCPNVFIDQAMLYLTDSEFRVLMFATRHIMGWQDKIKKRQGAISLTMFQNGFTTVDGKRYQGCGLGKETIIAALKSLVEYGFLTKEDEPTPDGQVWGLHETGIKWGELITRADATENKRRKQTDGARKAKQAKRTASTVEQTTISGHNPGLLNNTMQGTVEQTTPSTVEQTESKPSSKPSSKPRGGVRFPKQYRDWTVEHIRQYSAMHAHNLETLVNAWDQSLSTMYSSISEMAKVTAIYFIEALDELTRLNCPPESFQSLAAFTRATLHWKGSIKPIDMAAQYAPFRLSRLSTPTAPAQPFDLSEWHINEFNPEEMES